MKRQDLITVCSFALIAVALGATISNPTLATLLAALVTKWLGS